MNMIYPIAPFSSPGKSNVCNWEGFLSDEDINYILSRPEWFDNNDAKIGSGFSDGIVDKEQRTTTVSWMGCDEKNHVIWQKITNAIWSANRQYFQFDLTGCYEHAQLGVYSDKDNGHYDWHIDSGLEVANVPRKLSMALLLSDPSEFEGGELQIKSDNNNIFQVEQKRGRAWFFPSWTLHRVTPVTKGLRRSLVLWAGGPAFK
jgi:PKHD-type hydroxylase